MTDGPHSDAMDDDELDAVAAWLVLEALCLRCGAREAVSGQPAAARWFADHEATCPRPTGQVPSGGSATSAP